MAPPSPVTSNLGSSNDTCGAALGAGAGAVALGGRKIDCGAAAAAACQDDLGPGAGGAGAWHGAFAGITCAAAAFQVASGGGDGVEPTPG